MPIRTQRLRKSPISHQTRHSESSNSSPSNGRRTSQTARKSTGCRAPPKVSAESSESSSAAHNTPSPIVSAHTPEPAVPCNLCPSPLQIAQSPAVDPSQPIQDLLTVCKHHFHYACYMRHLTTSPINSRGYCPTCQASCEHLFSTFLETALIFERSINQKPILGPRHHKQRQSGWFAQFTDTSIEFWNIPVLHRHHRRRRGTVSRCPTSSTANIF